MGFKHRFQTRLAAVGIIIALLLSGCWAKQAPESLSTMPPEPAATIPAIATEPTAATEPTESVATEPEETVPPAPLEYDGTITVAVYPHLPDLGLFYELLIEQWDAVAPNAELEFVHWDCYENPEPGNDPQGIDIIMYDAVFTSYLVENGIIQPIQLSDVLGSEGFLPFTLDGAYHNGALYGIPYLACSFFLIHDTDDPALAQVENFSDLYAAVSEKMDADSSDGLLVEYYSDLPYFYLDALMDFSGEYTTYDTPPDLDNLNPQVMKVLQNIASVVMDTPSGYQKYSSFKQGAAFNDGYGSAYCGFSESMAFMEDKIDDITIRSLSFSDKENVCLYYTDLVSMGSHVTDPEKQAACIRLMNLIGSEEFQRQLCFGSEEVQYLLPARQSLYSEAAQLYPMYGQLQELVMHGQNRIVRFGPEIYNYFNEAYTYLLSWVEAG